MTTLGTFFPGLGEGNTLLAVGLASACVWLFHYLIARGVRQAAADNWIVTVAKLVPIVVFIIIVGFAFDPQTFAANFCGGDTRSMRSLFDQVKDTMLVTTFVFLGVEGASVYSRFARRREDVGRATLLGFLSVLAIFASVTMVSYGVLPREDLANTHPPSMAAVLESVVGSWAATFISIGVIISVQGAYLAWTLINAEVLHVPATTAVMPRFLARNNKNHAPIAALITTNLAVQALLLTVLFVRDALDFMLALDTALSLVPYLFVRDTLSSSRSPERPTRQPTNRNAGDSRSLPPRPCRTRSSCCTPRALNTSWWPASSTAPAPCSTSGPDGSRAGGSFIRWRPSRAWPSSWPQSELSSSPRAT
jgi:arginine:ornithine antiporter/lysine permease